MLSAANRDAGPVGEPVNAAGRSPLGNVLVEAPHLVRTGNPVAPSASRVAVRATNHPVEQLDLFALLAPRIARLGTGLPKPWVETQPTRRATPAWPFLSAQPLAVETAEVMAQTGAHRVRVRRLPIWCPGPQRMPPPDAARRVGRDGGRQRAAERLPPDAARAPRRSRDPLRRAARNRVRERARRTPSTSQAVGKRLDRDRGSSWVTGPGWGRRGPLEGGGDEP